MVRLESWGVHAQLCGRCGYEGRDGGSERTSSPGSCGYRAGFPGQWPLGAGISTMPVGRSTEHHLQIPKHVSHGSNHRKGESLFTVVPPEVGDHCSGLYKGDRLYPIEENRSSQEHNGTTAIQPSQPSPKKRGTAQPVPDA